LNCYSGNFAIEGIVHGDIKPQNVLIFKDKNTTFAAKVTDFGYSTCYDCDDCLIQLPKSEPWHAPEYDSSGILPAQALRMDIFSLALLFLWFIFERQFSGIQPFPDEADWAKRIPLDDSDETLCIFIEKAKKDKTLIQLASQLVSNDQCLSFDEKSGLCEFFEMSLESDLDLRAATLERSLRPFGRERYAFPAPDRKNV
jgi:serine/threonine protein kinase